MRAERLVPLMKMNTRLVTRKQLLWSLFTASTMAVVGLWIHPELPLRKASAAVPAANGYQRRIPVDTSGLGTVTQMTKWLPSESLDKIASRWSGIGYRQVKRLDRLLSKGSLTPGQRASYQIIKAQLLNYEGVPAKAYAVLAEGRAEVESRPEIAKEFLYTYVFLQGLAGMRLGETENCIHCRGASACIIPFDPAAVHRNKRGSLLAVRHFTEYLRQFPDDLQVRWLLNLAHMTLGEYPNGVDPRYRLSLDHFAHSEFDIGKFTDISYRVGLDRLNEAGGAIMDDFDNDGRLDLITSSYDPAQPMAFFRNTGKGGFEDRSKQAGLMGVLGGLNCVQTDYNNDGRLDVFVPRGAWQVTAMRPSLLRNDGNGHFTDVASEAGLDVPLNSNSGVWADYDNDGFLDLFVCCEQQPNRLYHNLGDGRFEEVSVPAGLRTQPLHYCKGATWIDYDRDDYPDLLINNLNGSAQLFHNDRNGHFTEVTTKMGINGPQGGFSCWAFDYDNDGWPDLFATCYQRTQEGLINGILGKPHNLQTSRLYHNDHGRRFVDVTREAGLDGVYATMGNNFGDFDNDGYLDIYLATGEPDLATLVPNRMFRNVDGRRFAEITGTSRTGHLQKGHGVACGDWDGDGNVDLFVEMGGAVPGDRYHNVLFQNPGHKAHWLTVKLAGVRTNRAAIGATIRVVTGGASPQNIYRTVSSGSSFGGNPLQQTIGLGQADTVATLEVHWPTSHTTQVFHQVAVDQSIEVTELTSAPRVLRPPHTLGL